MTLQPSWLKTVGSVDHWYQYTDVDGYADGSVIACGQYEDETTWNNQGHVRKYAADGTMLWEGFIHGDFGWIYSVAALPDGGAILVGGVIMDGSGVWSYEVGGGSGGFTSSGSPAFAEWGFIIRVDANGAWQWRTQIPQGCFISSVSVNDAGDQYFICGNWSGTYSLTLGGSITLDPDPVSGVFGVQTGFVAKLQGSGVWQWGATVTHTVTPLTYSASKRMVIEDVTPDEAGGAWVVGRFGPNSTDPSGATITATFGSHTVSGTFAPDTENIGMGFLAHVDSSGTWADATHPPGCYSLWGIGSPDGSTLYYVGAEDTNSDGTVWKSNGTTPVWQTVATPTTEFSGHVNFQDVSVAADGTVLAAAQMPPDQVFGSLPAFDLDPSGDCAVVVRLNPEGVFIEATAGYQLGNLFVYGVAAAGTGVVAVGEEYCYGPPALDVVWPPLATPSASVSEASGWIMLAVDFTAPSSFTVAPGNVDAYFAGAPSLGVY